MIATLVIYLSLTFTKVAVFHDFHSSIAELNFNEKTGTYELALRVFADDFLLALSHEAKKEELLYTDPNIEVFIEKYLHRHFAFVKDKSVILGEYLGKEVETDVIWFYLEFKTPPKLDGYQLLYDVLMDQFSDQANILNLKYKSQKKTILFDKDKKTALYPF